MNIIQNKTKIDKNDMVRFLNNAGIQNLWLVGFCSVIIALLGFTIENGTLVYRNFLFLIVGILVIPVYFLILRVHFSKQIKNFKGIENEYIFNDESFSVVGTTAGITEKFDMNYHSLFKVKETKSYVYLYVNNYSALIINKKEDCFTQGDALRLRKFLNLKLTAKQNHLIKTN
jgi:hypothetical protein